MCILQFFIGEHFDREFSVIQKNRMIFGNTQLSSRCASSGQRKRQLS